MERAPAAIAFSLGIRLARACLSFTQPASMAFLLWRGRKMGEDAGSSCAPGCSRSWQSPPEEVPVGPRDPHRVHPIFRILFAADRHDGGRLPEARGADGKAFGFAARQVRD